MSVHNEFSSIQTDEAQQQQTPLPGSTRQTRTSSRINEEQENAIEEPTVRESQYMITPVAVLVQQAATSVKQSWDQFWDRQRQATPTIRVSTMQNAIENRPWGNQLETVDRNPEHTRLYSVNVNGFQLDSEGGKYDEFCRILQEIKCDIACVQEHNLDTTQYKVQRQLHETTRKRWKWHRLTYASSPFRFHSVYKPGGTLMLTMDKTASRIIHTGRDKWGRWTYQTLQGANNTRITVISAYQVVNSHAATQGATTVASQQRSLLIQSADELQDPREAFRRDLSEQLQQLQENGQDIILLGDFNEKMTADYVGMSKIAIDFNLIDLMRNRHPQLDEVATYARGSTRLDYILASPRVVQCVVSCGYEPFHQRLVTDHRPYFVDFDTKMLFGAAVQPMATYAGRVLHANNANQVTDYIEIKHALFTKHNVFARASRLSKPGERHEWAERIDKDIVRASLSAEKKLKFYGTPQWSIKLRNARRRQTLVKRILSMHKTRMNLTEQILADYEDNDITDAELHTVDACSRLLRATRREIKEIVTEHVNHRESERAARIEELENSGSPEDRTHAKRLRAQRTAENVNLMFKKIRRFMKPTEHHSVMKVEVPTNDEDDPKTCQQWKTIDTPSEVQEHFQRRNRKHFGQAHGTPFTVAPLAEQLGFTGCTPTAQQVLDGMFMPDDTVDENAKDILHHLRYASSGSVTPIITRDAYIRKLKKWRESTTTSPSGVHLGHYKAMISRHKYSDRKANDPDKLRLDKMQSDIFEVYVHMINYATTRAYSYRRWQNVVNTILWKEAGNYKIHRSRVIHLYEADYNLAISIKWRDAQYEAEKLETLAEGQYGSRSHRCSHDPVLLEVLQTEISRITRKSLVLMNFDATSCYDRIIPSIATLASRKYGVPDTVAEMSAKTLENTVYKVKTGLGISETGYKHCLEHPIYGTGQGSGNSPSIWCMVSSLLFKSYDDRIEGAYYEFPDRTGRIDMKMVGYVDDSNGQANQFGDRDQSNTDALISKTKAEITAWNDILWASGGALELSKTSYQVLKWIFTQDGAPILAGGLTGDDIHIQDRSNAQQLKKISQLSAHTAHKTLGHYMTPSGNQTQQFLILKKKSDREADLMWKSPFNRHEAWIYYFAMYLPSVGHPLALTHFTKMQLQEIQKKATSAIIAKCGYNRNTSRAVIFGSTMYGGANFRHLYSIQGISQLQLFIRHWREETTQAGRLLRISVAWLQLSAGISASVFQDVEAPIDYCESKWLLSIRGFLQHIKGSLQIEPTYVIPKERQNDLYIMEEITKSKWFTRSEIRQLNYCRLYLQVVLVSDLATAPGTHLDTFMLKGERTNARSSTGNGHWFHQDRPSQRIWRLWKKANLLWADAAGKLRMQLGVWKSNRMVLHRRRAWPAYQQGDEVYIRKQTDHSLYDVYRRQPGQFIKFQTTGETIEHANLQSIHAAPVEARRQFPSGYRVLQPPETEQAVPQPLPPNTFYEYIDELDKWENELLENHEMLNGATVEVVRTAITEGVVFACDGAVSEYETGSFGWSLSTLTGRRLVKCAGPVRGYKLTSYRAEGYGCLSVVRYIHRVFHYLKEEVKSHQISIYCDNESMVNQVSALLPQVLHDETAEHTITKNSLDPLQPDWDVLQEIWSTTQTWEPLTLKHVKGHQDRERPVRSLPLPAQLNVEADAMASNYIIHNPKPKRKALLFPSTKVHLHINNATVTSKYSHRIRQEESKEESLSYLKTKYQWTTRAVREINWRAHGIALRRQYVHRTHFTKMVNDCLPTNKEQHRWNAQQSEQCPRCQNVTETRDHVIRCEKSANWRVELHQKLRTQMEASNTHPGLKHLLQRGIMNWSIGHETLSTEGYDEELTNLIYSQNAIGWRQLFNGRWSTLWAKIQSRHEKERMDQDVCLRGDEWTVNMTTVLWNHWWELWTKRNESVHGHDAATRRAMETERLRRRVQALYALKERVEPAIERIFKESIDEIAAKGVQYMHDWLEVHESNILASAKRVAERELRGTRRLTTYFGMHIDNPG